MSKISKEEKKRYQLISKILGIFARIGNVCCWIGAVACLVGGITFTAIIPQIEINKEDKTVSVFDEKISYEIKDDEIKLGDEEEFIVKLSEENKRLISQFIEDNLKLALWVAVAAMAGGAIMISLAAMILNHAAKVLKNIATQVSPFTEENVEHLKKAQKLLLITFIAGIVLDVCLTVVTSVDMSLNTEFTSVSSILGIYVLTYIFRSGLEKSEKKEIKE